MSDPMVCTIGHSNRAIEDFVALLWSNEIARVIDVRTVPRSRRNPQFNLDALPATLEDVGIAYTHLPGLGGLRRPAPDSPQRRLAQSFVPGATRTTCSPRRSARTWRRLWTWRLPSGAP